MKSFKLLLCFSFIVFHLTALPQWIPHIIDSALPHATIIDTADIDNDGDLDMAANGSPYVILYENISPDSAWSKHYIDNTLSGAVGIAIVDVDGDNLLDIVASGYGSSQVRWYRNEGVNLDSWHKYIVDEYFLGAEYLRVDDIDGDGDPDIVQGGSIGNSLAWYENNMPDTVWTRHYIVNGTLPQTMGFDAADIDKDSDLDIVVCANNSNDVLWYENNLPDTNWMETKIEDHLTEAFDLCVGDIDGDSTLDVVATGQVADKVNWYSTEDSGKTWTQQNIQQNIGGARCINLAKIDDDNDLDIVVTGYDEGRVYWIENRLPDSWILNEIDTDLPTANYVCTADINEDGELDVLATGRESNFLMWYENALKRIYAKNTNISKPYMIPSYDTLIVTTEFSNFHQHNFTANALCTSIYGVYSDSLILYDDGLHGDSLSNDGKWGAFIYPFSEEDFFSMGISSLDLETGQYFYKDDMVRFTTAGPLSLDSITFIESSGDYYYLRPFIHSNGNSLAIEDVSVKILCSDPWVSSLAQPIVNFPVIDPGQSAGGNSLSVISYIDSIYPGHFNISVEIMVDDWIYWLDSTVIITGVKVEYLNPLTFSLSQNYPNPFNPTTTINYSVPELSFITLKVFDVLGCEVTTLLNEEKPAGSYEVKFSGQELSGGVYFYRLKTGKFVYTKKMILLK